jgi:sulfite reductase alpha subunit-like flavoprotein
MEEEESAIYICGSLGMGHDVSEVLAKKAGGH